MSRKNFQMIKALSVILILIMVFPFLSACTKKETHAVIIYTNDVHCAIDDYGILSAYVKSSKLKNKNVFTIDGGDYLQGNFNGKVDDGKSITDIMNTVGYDYVVPGNHDYDYGMKTFLNNAANSKFEFLSCNFSGTEEESKKFKHQAYAIKEFDGHKLGFIGIECLDDKDTSVTLINVQNAVDELNNKGAEAIIAIGHTGGKPTQEIIESTNNIDIYLNAHDHVLSDDKDKKLSYKNQEGKSVPVFETGSSLQYLLKLDLNFKNDKIDYTVSMEEISDLKNEIDKSTNDEVISAKTNTERKINACKQLTEKENRKVGVSECVLCVYDPVKFPDCNDLMEYNSSNMIADAFKDISGADIGIVNTTALRTGIQKGDVYIKDIVNLYPWFEKVYLVELTGQQIFDMIYRGCDMFPEYNPTQPAVSGLTFTLDTTVDKDVKDRSKRLYDIKINNKDIDMKKTYTVASSLYYLFVANKDIVKMNPSDCLSVGLDYGVVSKYIEDTLHGVIPESLYKKYSGDGRIKVLY